MGEVLQKAKRLKEQSAHLASLDTKYKNAALLQVGESIIENIQFILQQNAKDVEAARESGMKESLVDRLLLTEDRVKDMVEGLRKIVDLKDPVWRSKEVWTLDNGLTISKMTVPIGVIGMIYESRPNVTVDAFGLAFKSGNCMLLRGSSTALHSNKALVQAIHEGLEKAGISRNVVALVEDPNRETVKDMLTLNGYMDLIIPRGGAGLIQFVTQNATVPTIETGVGNCHIYIDDSAKLDDALKIVENAKVQRPGVCNAAETILVHREVAAEFLPALYDQISSKVEFRGCEKTREIIHASEAVEQDWEEEFLDYILAVKVVDSIEEAIEHIGRYGTKHSEAIVTENYTKANQFLRLVDAAAVYVNASTRFTDGSQFGFGAEIGISTQKMHARGPMGLDELVTIKYTILGKGQIRE